MRELNNYINQDIILSEDDDNIDVPCKRCLIESDDGCNYGRQGYCPECYGSVLWKYGLVDGQREQYEKEIYQEVFDAWKKIITRKRELYDSISFRTRSKRKV